MILAFCDPNFPLLLVALAQEELQQLTDLVAQLRADNERMLRDGSTGLVSGGVASTSSVTAGCLPGVRIQATVLERLVVVPRDRKCPMFNGKTCINIAKWVEESSSMHACPASVRY